MVDHVVEDERLCHRVRSVFGVPAQDLPDLLAARNGCWVGSCCLVEGSP